jgi:TonB family protein
MQIKSGKWEIRRVLIISLQALFFFVHVLHAQKMQDGINFKMDPVITQQQVILYSDFEKLAMQWGDNLKIRPDIMKSILASFIQYRANRIIRPQEWRYILLNEFYKNNINYKIANTFLLYMPFYPVDTGFLASISIPGIAALDTKNIRNAAEDDGKIGYTMPIALSKPDPFYTWEARQVHVKGKMMIEAIIGKNGRVIECRTINGLGYGLEESAINTIINKWQFKPGTYESKAIDMKINLEIAFNIK